MSLRPVLARAAVVLEGDHAQLLDSLDEAEAAMKAAGATMTDIGKKMTMAITLPLAATGAAAVATANSYEQSMKQISALTETSTTQVQAWSDEVRQLAMEYGSSAKEAADALFFITGAGVQGAAAMEALQAALLGTAIGLGETKTIADAATSAMNAYEKQGLSATRATEILAAGIKYGKFEAAALAPVLGSVVGTASALNITFDDLVGTLAIFSRTGTDAAEGATQLSAIMSTLLGTSKEGEKALAAQGLSLAGLRKEVQGPHGLVNVMRTLDKAFAGNLDQLAVVIPNVRAFRGVMNVLAQDAGTVNDILDGTSKSMGLLDKAFRDMQGPALDTKRVWAVIKDALLEVGQVIAPVVIPPLLQAAKAVRALAEWFGDLDPVAKAVVGTLVAIVAAAGPMLLVFGAIAKTLAVIKVASLLGQLGALTTTVAIGGPLVIGLAAVAAAFAYEKKVMDDLNRTLKQTQERHEALLRGTDPKIAEQRASNLATRIDQLKATLALAKKDSMKAQSDMTAVKPKSDRGAAMSVENLELLIKGLEQEKMILLEVVKAAKLANIAVVPPVVASGVKPAAWAEDASKAMVQLGRDLDKVTLLSGTLGAEFNADEEKARAYATAIDTLADAGVPLDAVLNKNGDTLRSLAAKLGVVTGQVTAAQVATDAYNESLTLAQRAVESTMTPTQQFRQVVDALTVAFNAGKISQEDFIRGATAAEDALYGVDDAVQKAMAAVQAAVTPQQQFEEVQQALNVALGEGRISMEQYNSALKFAQKSMQDATSTASVLQDGIENVTSRALDDLVSLAFGMKKTFHDFVMSALQDLTRLIVRMQVMRYLFPTAAGATSPLHGLIPGFADGGFLGGNKWGIVGERGPELVMAGRSGMTVTPGPVGNGGMTEGGGATAIAFNVSANDQRGVAQFFEENEGYIVRAFTKAQQRSRALQRRLGT